MLKSKILIVDNESIGVMDILRIFFLYLFIQCCILSFHISPSRAAESVTLQLKWKHQFQFAGYYAAIEKGYYKAEGLNVTLIEGKPGGDEVEEVISGRANFGVGMSDILIARLRGKPVVALAAIFQHSPSVFLTIKSSDILSPQDLFGKKIMMSLNFKSAELQAMLASEGITADNVTFIKPSWKLDDLINGKVDARAAYISSAPYFLKKKNIPYTILSPISYGIDFYGDNLFTSQKEIKQNPKRVMAFKKASLKGWQYAMDNTEEIIDIILLKYAYGRKDLTREFLVNEASSYQKLILSGFVKIGHMNPGRWNHIAEFYAKLGMIDKEYSLEGFLYDSIQKKFDWGHWIVKLGAAVIITGLLSTIFLLFFNRRLNLEIYDRKRAEDELIKSDKLYKEVQSLAHIGHWNYDSLNDELTWSDGIYSIFEIDRDDGPLSIKDILARIPPKERDVIREQVEKGEDYRSDYRIVMDDGAEKYVHEDVIILRGEDGKIINMRGTAQDITQLRMAESRLQRERNKFRAILDSMVDGIYIVNKDYDIQYVNPALTKDFGPPEGKKCHELFHDSDKPCTFCKNEEVFKGKTVHWEWTSPKTNKTYDLIDSPIINPDGSIHKLELFRDMTERKQDQERISASLKEKEILLSEIHHRVKNNMQVVVSLLRLQSGREEDTKIIDLLKESENRILSMALVHEQLYQSEDFSNIDFGEYISNLVNSLFSLYGIDTKKIKLNIDCVDVLLDLDNAIPCGLIINELVTNSLKHAFTNGQKGKINISMLSINDDCFKLTVYDNGVGISEDLNISDIDSMGLLLVRVLAEETLEGKMELERTNGTKFNIKLKKTKYNKRV